jgi:hypothetical protein
MNGTSGLSPVPRQATTAAAAPPVPERIEPVGTAAVETDTVTDIRAAEPQRKPWPQVPHGAVYAPGAPGADEQGMLAFPGLMPRSIVEAILGKGPSPEAIIAGPSWLRRGYEKVTDLRP